MCRAENNVRDYGNLTAWKLASEMARIPAGISAGVTVSYKDVFAIYVALKSYACELFHGHRYVS
jgi:hypothetical protein